VGGCVMREILFRGKCTDTGRWYEGQYIHLQKTTYCFSTDYDMHPDNDIHQIVFERMTDWCLPNQHLRADVIPETVGQFTGLTDKNGKKIFEGDILSENGYLFVVVWDQPWAKFRLQHDGRCYQYPEWNRGIRMEILGNIHDNPELLEES
jgi:uncharacterized phage protein (TIGR01671 family)